LFALYVLFNKSVFTLRVLNGYPNKDKTNNWFSGRLARLEEQLCPCLRRHATSIVVPYHSSGVDRAFCPFHQFCMYPDAFNVLAPRSVDNSLKQIGF